MKRSVNVYVSEELSVTENTENGSEEVQEKSKLVRGVSIMDEDISITNTETKVKSDGSEKEDLNYTPQDINKLNVTGSVSVPESAKNNLDLRSDKKETEVNRTTKEEKSSLSGINTVNHGEFVIRHKIHKKKSHQKTKPALNLTQVGFGQRREANVEIRQSTRPYEDTSSDSQNYNNDKTSDSNISKIESDQKNNESKSTEAQEMSTVTQKEEKEGKDLGADIIVLIVIGVIAGIAGFSYIFTQLGLINR